MAGKFTFSILTPIFLSLLVGALGQGFNVFVLFLLLFLNILFLYFFQLRRLNQLKASIVIVILMLMQLVFFLAHQPGLPYEVADLLKVLQPVFLLLSMAAILMVYGLKVDENLAKNTSAGRG